MGVYRHGYLAPLNNFFNVWWELGLCRRLPPDPGRENSEDLEPGLVNHAVTNRRRDSFEKLPPFRPHLPSLTTPQEETLRGIAVASGDVVLAMSGGMSD